MDGTWNQNKFQMKILLGGKNAKAKFTSTFKNFEKLRGNAVWKVAKGEKSEYGLTTNFENCNDSECTTSLFFQAKIDTEPFSFLTLKIIAPGYLNESLSLQYNEKYLQYSVVADYRGYKTYHLNATLNIWKRSIDIVINNKSEKRLWKLKTNAEIQTLLDGNVAVNVQLIFYTPFTKNFKAIVIVDMVNPEKQFELTFKYGIIDASLKTKLFWSFQKSLMFFRVLCPSIGIQNLSFFGRTENFRTLLYRFQLNENKWEVSVNLKTEESKFDCSFVLLTPLKRYNITKIRIFGDILGDDKETGMIELELSSKKFTGSYARNGLNIHLDIKSQYSNMKYFFLKSNVERCKNYDLQLEINQRKIILENRINCETFETTIDYKSDFELMKQLKIEFLPSAGDFQTSLKFLGTKLDMHLMGNIFNVSNGKHFVWAIDCNGEHFKANMSFNLKKERYKRIEMVYLWSMKRIEILSTLNIEEANNPLFFLYFKSNLPNLEKVNFEASLKNINSTLEGKLLAILNNDRLQVELGSVGNHLYLEADTPIIGFRTVKFDVNHLNHSVKAKAIFDTLTLEANFIRKDTIYNFAITSNLEQHNFKFVGKVDIASKSLQTLVVLDDRKLRMKANTNGRSMSASLTSQYETMKNVKVKGNWQWINNGFRVEASARLFSKTVSSSKRFVAEFSTNSEKTFGFWRVISDSEEILFNMSVEKALPNSMKIILSITLPKQEPVICILSYFDKNNYVGGTLELKNPWKFVQITFYGGFKTNDEFEFTSFIKYPDEIFDLEMKIRAATTNDVDFRIKCIIPALRKEFGSMFTFKPLSIDDFQLFIILNINEEKFGGGMSLKFDFHNPDLLIKIYTPVISGEFNIGARYNLTNSSGDFLLYFNHATIQVNYDLPKGSFSARAQFNVDYFLKALVGSIININIPSAKLVKGRFHCIFCKTLNSVHRDT